MSLEFNLFEKPSSQLINIYQNKLPNKIVDFWREYGFGSFLKGYLKVVNPKDFKYVLAESYLPQYENPIVMFATGMGDLIVWENNYTILVDYRHGISKVIESGFKYFLEDINDTDFLEEELNWLPYESAREKLGDLAYDECYGYVPILAAGGAEKVRNLQKVKLKEHIAIITELAGQVE